MLKLNNDIKILIISKQLDLKTNRSVYKNLAKKGYSIDIIVPNKEVQLSTDEKKYLNIVCLKTFGFHPRGFFIPNLYFFFKKIKYEHIFIENDISSIICFQICFIKLFIKNTSISVFTLENIYKNYLALTFGALCKFNLKKIFAYLVLHFLEKFNKKYISKIFVFSNESYKIHKSKFTNSEINKIPLGIDHSIFTKKIIKNNLLQFGKDKKIIIGVFGRIDKNRGSDLILKLLIKKKKQLRFEIILDCFHEYENNYTRLLIKKYKINFPNQLHLINPSHEKIAQYIQLSDLIIIPSIETKNVKEQYGRLIVEAKLAKTMIIASDIGAFPETIKNRGLIFKSNFYSLEKKFESILNLNYFEKKKIIFINSKHSLRFQTSISQAEKIHEKIK